MSSRRIASFLITSTILGTAACVATPKPIGGEIALPQTVETVWLRADELHPALVVNMPVSSGPILTPVKSVVSDTGTLTVAADRIEYEGRLHTIRIPYDAITDISFGRLGGDLFNRWITVRYGVEGESGEVSFSAGKALGWAGGTSDIYALVDYSFKRYQER